MSFHFKMKMVSGQNLILKMKNDKDRQLHIILHHSLPHTPTPTDISIELVKPHKRNIPLSVFIDIQRSRFTIQVASSMC